MDAAGAGPRVAVEVAQLNHLEDDGTPVEPVFYAPIIPILLANGGKGIGTGRPSLAQDVFKGRKTEVEELNGLVVRKGKELGIPTPVNQSVVEVTKRVEAGELAPAQSNIELIKSLW